MRMFFTSLILLALLSMHSLLQDSEASKGFSTFLLLVIFAGISYTVLKGNDSDKE